MAQSGTMQADRQLPAGEEIFLDHIGHFVRDQETAARALARAGFAVAPVSIQTSPAPAGGAPQLTGTGNVTAMLARGYIEGLFKTADTPLGRELDAALARYGGVHLAAFAVADAAAAHRRLAASGFRMRPLVEMDRPVDAGGKRETAAFTIARRSLCSIIHAVSYRDRPSSRCRNRADTPRLSVVIRYVPQNQWVSGILVR